MRKVLSYNQFSTGKYTYCSTPNGAFGRLGFIALTKDIETEDAFNILPIKSQPLAAFLDTVYKERLKPGYERA
jgi:hypothetical protein